MVCRRQPLIGQIPVIRLQQVLHDVIGGLLVGVQRGILAGEKGISLGACDTNDRFLGDRGDTGKQYCKYGEQTQACFHAW